ncbi:MAG TPA: phage portal protein, partial [Anaerolineae bacterium]|nr:phage portal protein [Anaerolineae bacterium]
MVAVQSLGALATVEGSRRAMSGGGSLRLYSTYYQTYEQLYEKQPNVRTCVDFLARNIAQLGLHVYQRKGETDRVRLREHPLALLLQKPLPAEYKVTRYRLIESLISDLGIYFNAYWIKVRASAGTMGLLRVPPGLMTVYGKLWPVRYEMYTGGTPRSFMPEEIVHFRGYNPSNPIFGLSPLETLRRVLAEEYAMGEYREHFWSNAARINGIIERPAPGPGVTEWSHTAKTRFIEEFGQFYSTPGNFGKTPVLEDGMTWKAQAFNAQESEYLAGRKLTREECARAYHIPLPM